MENEVENDLLTDWESGEGPEFTEYCPPQRLYSCLSIRELYLAGCKLEIYGNVQWDHLKYLKIEGVSLSEHVTNQILSSSPQLEVLSLSLVEVYGRFTIHSSSLKELKIAKFNFGKGFSVLTIWAPNVEILEILGHRFGNYVMMNVSSLTNATAEICFLGGDDDIVQFSGYKLLEDIMRQVYQTNRDVEKVALSAWCIKMLEGMKKQKKHMFESLSNAKFLKLYGCEVDQLMGLLEVFSNLTKLVLEEYWIKKAWGIYEIQWGMKNPSITKFDTDNNLESQTDFPNSYLLHLNTVELSWIPYYDSIFPIVEFFLKNASNLKKLVVRAR